MKSRRNTVLLVLTLAIVLFGSILILNTLRFTSKQIQVEPIQTPAVNEGDVATRLAQALRFQTVSQEGVTTKGEEFLRLHRYLEQTFPKVHSLLSKEVVSDYSLLYIWRGRNEQLKPILLMGHADVVPVDPETLPKWEHPPFEGRIIDGYVWGRGAMDDKFALISIMEAVEMHLAEGFQPQRTIYLAFGHDEEVGGHNGAAKIAELLRTRNVQFEYVLDEGLSISEGVVPDLTKPVAAIGVADKGYLSLELKVQTESGHSSMPPSETAIGVLSAAVTKLEASPMPASIEGVQRQTLEYLGPEMPFGRRLVIANLWLFKPLVARKLAASPSTNASIRSTTAATIFESGIKENVLPTRARAVVNFRILPGDTTDLVIAHVSEVVNDARVKVSRFGDSNNDPSPISRTDTLGYEIIQRTMREVFPGILVAPALCVGGTDSEYYITLSDNIYRFSPLRVRPEDIKRLHGIDERTSVKDYAASVRFYYQLISNSAQ